MSVVRDSPPIRRSPAERLAAWIVTGPLGHLWSAVADIGSFAVLAGASRVRQRMLAGLGRRPSARR